MKTSPVFGWPIADDPDPVKQFPAAVDEPRTLAIEAALARAYGSSVREGDAAGGTGVWTPVAAAVTIPNAPAGLYQVSVTGTMARAGGVGTPLQLSITAGGQTLFERTVEEVNDDFVRTVAAALTAPWAGGNLTVTVAVRGTLAPCVARAGSRIDVARLGV
jgi:hypothetical protein